MRITLCEPLVCRRSGGNHSRWHVALCQSQELTREDRHCVVHHQAAQEHAPIHFAQIFVESVSVRFFVIEAKALYDILLGQCEFDGDLGAKVVAETRHSSSRDKIAIRWD